MNLRLRTLSLLLGIVLGAATIGIALWKRPRAEPVQLELTRGELTLREDRLYAAGQDERFTGKLIENFSPKHRKLEIDLKDGKADGFSRGWYEDGQLEVEEHFAQGISNGMRTRWHGNGTMKSTAQIVKGQMEGPYVEWHENGVKAVEMTMHGGHPDGMVRAWHPNGERMSETTFAGGKIATREFWPSIGAEAGAGARGANP